MSDSLQPHGLQNPRLLCPLLLPLVCSDSCPSSRWCHPNISSSTAPFSSCLQSFPASESFAMSQLLASGGQGIRASASASVLPMTIQGWSPLRLTGLISDMETGCFQKRGSLRDWGQQAVSCDPHRPVWGGAILTVADNLRVFPLWLSVLKIECNIGFWWTLVVFWILTSH